MQLSVLRRFDSKFVIMISIVIILIMMRLTLLMFQQSYYDPRYLAKLVDIYCILHSAKRGLLTRGINL